MIPYKNNSIVRVSEGPTGVFLFVLLNNDVSNLPVYADGVRTGSTAIVQDTGAVLLYHEDRGWSEYNAGGYPEPTGTIEITQNGTGIDVKDYASADVNVPNSYAAGDEGKVVSSGALVAQTSQSIDTNGTYDTTTKNEVVVSVAGGHDDEFIKRYFRGPYTNDSVTWVGKYAFYDCGRLTHVGMANCESVLEYAFGECGKNLFDDDAFSVDLPKAGDFAEYAFYNAKFVGVVTLPKAYDIGAHVFDSCADMTQLDLGDNGSGYSADAFNGGYVFSGCSSFVALILRATTTPWQLNSADAFLNSPIASGSAYIYVPDALKATYQAATNWSTYASQFRSLEDYTVDGTTTGALDPNKI